MASNLTPEHLALLDEAQGLQIDTMAYGTPDANLDELRMLIARQVEHMAREAASKRKVEQALLEAEQEEKESIRSVFDETMADTRGVLVRQVEWSEWLPVSQDENEPRLTIANGVTGLEAGRNEKVLSVDGLGTQIFKNVVEEGLTKRYMLYAFKATLAQNVHTSLIPAMIEAQGSNQEGEAQVKRPSGLVVPDHDGSNRQQRRHPNG